MLLESYSSVQMLDINTLRHRSCLVTAAFAILLLQAAAAAAAAATPRLPALLQRRESTSTAA